MQRFAQTIIVITAPLGLLSFILYAIHKVLSGDGTETYFTGFGVKFNYIGALTVFAIVFIILLIGGFYKWKSMREWKDLEDKYSGED